MNDAWAASPGSGSITVKVVDPSNNPFSSATVLINTNAVGTTDSTGTFKIPVIAAGSYEGMQHLFSTKGCYRNGLFGPKRTYRIH
jgi:hypothetical protein